MWQGNLTRSRTMNICTVASSKTKAKRFQPPRQILNEYWNKANDSLQRQDVQMPSKNLAKARRGPSQWRTFLARHGESSAELCLESVLLAAASAVSSRAPGK